MALPGVTNPLTSSLATVGRPQQGAAGAGGVRPGHPGG